MSWCQDVDSYALPSLYPAIINKLHMSTVLIVEDEFHLAEGLRYNLEAEGYKVDVVGDGESAIAAVQHGVNQYDAIVLDVMLPKRDGFGVASELRKAGKFLPILILTARGRPEDVLRGFEAGADDYLAKPFDLAILLARLRGLIRRGEWLKRGTGSQASSAESDDHFTFDAKTIDFSALELRVDKRVIRLTLMEAELLRYLVNHAGKVVSRKSMLEDVWGLHEDTDTRAIDNFIVRLRRYIEADASKPRHLQTVRGVGYRFTPDPGK